MNLFARPRILRSLLALLAVTLTAFAAPHAHAQSTFGTLTTLHSFSGTDGTGAYGGLLRLSDGSLYGTTDFYPNSGGSIYKIAPNGTFSTFHIFTGGDGSYPHSALIQASDGYLYGTGSIGANFGGSTAYRLAGDGTFTLLHTFSINDAYGINSTLVQGSDTNLYGTSGSGGPDGTGTLFKFATDGTGVTVLREFTAGDGGGSNNGVILANDGNFYGTLSNSIYRYGPAGFGIVHVFTSAEGGAGGASALYQATDGALYGTTYGGGSAPHGTVFRCALDGTFTVLHTFNDHSDGSRPLGKLVPGNDGALYGTTANGPAAADPDDDDSTGTIFRISLNGAFASLYAFNGTDGYSPSSELTPASDGSFYGTTDRGGSANDGTVFHYVPNASSPGAVQFDPANYAVNENAGTVTITVTRTGGFAGPASVQYATSDGATGAAGTDYTTTNGSLNWSDGDAEPKSFTVPIIDRSLYDNTQQQFSVTLSNPSFATLGTATTANVVVTENDTPQPPVITSAQMATGVDGQFFYYTITATGTGTGPGRFDATGLPPGLSVDKDFGTISGYPSQTGVYPVTISASNDYGTTPATLTITITTPGGGTGGSGTTDLTISVVDSPDPVVVGGTIKYRFTFGNKGPDAATGVVLQVVKDSNMTFVPNPFGSNPTINGNVLTFGLPDLASGTSNTVAFNFTADAVGYLTVGATIGGAQNDPVASNSGLLETTYVVAAGTALAPQVTSATSANAQVGVPFTYQITAANNPVRFAASGLPQGLSVDTGTGLISGTPAQGGMFNATISAANDTGTGSASLTLIVAASSGTTQPTIAITSPPDNVAVAVGTPVSIAANVADPDALLAKVQFYVNGLLVVTTKSAGPFTATAAPPAAGTYVLTAVATDKQGRTSNNTVTVTAFTPDANNPAPTSDLLTPLGGRDILAGSTITLTASADTSLPAGLDHISINVDGVSIATFDADGNLLASTQRQPARPAVHRADASATPLNKLFTASYQLPGADKLVNMIVVATDKLQHTAVSSVASFHSRVTTDRAPKVVFNNLSSLTRVSAGSVNTASVTATDPDAAGAGSSSTAGRGVVRQDAASDGTLAQLEFWLNGVNLAKSTNGTSTFDFTTPKPGKYVAHAVATDGSGLTTVSDPVIVEADATMPLVTIATLGDGQAVEGGAVGKLKVVRAGGDLSQPLTVHYKVAGAAKGGTDYKTLSGSVTILAGATLAKIKVKPIDNATADGTRVAKFKLKPATDGSYSLGVTTVAKVKVIDND